MLNGDHSLRVEGLHARGKRGTDGQDALLGHGAGNGLGIHSSGQREALRDVA